MIIYLATKVGLYMLLNIYLGTSLFCFASIIVNMLSFYCKLKNEGYKFSLKSTFLEDFLALVQLIMTSLVPILNLYFSYCMLFETGSEFYEKSKADLIKNNVIYKTDDSNKILTKLEKEPITKKFEATKTSTMENPKKEYEEMTIAKKRAYLHQEMAKLLDLSLSLDEETKTLDDDVPRTRTK